MLETKLRRSVLFAFLHCVFSCESSSCLPERIHLHIGCIGDWDEEEWKVSMGAKESGKVTWRALVEVSVAGGTPTRTQVVLQGSRRVTQLQVRDGIYCMQILINITSMHLEGVYMKESC